MRSDALTRGKQGVYSQVDSSVAICPGSKRPRAVSFKRAKAALCFRSFVLILGYKARRTRIPPLYPTASVRKMKRTLPDAPSAIPT